MNPRRALLEGLASSILGAIWQFHLDAAHATRLRYATAAEPFCGWAKRRGGSGSAERKAGSLPTPDAPVALPMNSVTLRSQAKLKRGPSAAAFSATLLLCAGLALVGVTPSFASEANPARQELDRIAYAVDGAESSHGTDPAMWRPDPAAPQGPMQVSAKAARDVGGGDRFDTAQNQAIGRAYLALLYRRYGNWPDTVSAYNWGMGNLDHWIRTGRPSRKLAPTVAVYSRRVLAASGLCAVYGAHRDCTEATYHGDLLYIGSYYRSALAPPLAGGLEIPAQEQRGRMLVRLVFSGDPIPGRERSGQPLPEMAQSGRPLSRLVGSGRPRGRPS